MPLLDDTLTIPTQRLLLRPLRHPDAAPLFALFNSWPVIRYLSSPPWPYRLADAEWFVAAAMTHDPELAEEVRAITHSDALIGVIGVRQREAGSLQRGAGPNIGYWIGEPYWGRGFMTETVRAFVQHIFKSSDADAIYSGAFAENVASLRVQEKVGFVRDGDTTLYAKPRGGDFPHVNTVLTRTRFEQQQQTP
jgi:RimJ/RimL family protein N-acetyltransferase